MMKIVAISDTHTFEDQIVVPEGDVLIHAGDATIEGSIAEVARFAEWFQSQPHEHKIFVAGNHDWLFQTQRALARSMIEDFAYYLEDSLVEIEGVTFYGSPWQPEFCNWAFNVRRGQDIARKWNMIPEGVDVLITHGPPYGIRDWAIEGGEHLGCEELLKRVERIKPRFHVFGHIHGGAGGTTRNGTLFYNVSICDESYAPVNAAATLELIQD